MHPVWGVIAMPLHSMLYVRAVDVPKLAEKYDWAFRTKHQLGVELLTWFMRAIRALRLEVKVWLPPQTTADFVSSLKPSLPSPPDRLKCRLANRCIRPLCHLSRTSQTLTVN